MSNFAKNGENSTFSDPPYEQIDDSKLIIIFLSGTLVALSTLIRRTFISEHFGIFGNFSKIFVHISHTVSI